MSQTAVIKGIKNEKRVEFDKQVKKLNTLCKRLKVEEPTLHIGDVYEKTYKAISGMVSDEYGNTGYTYSPVIVDVFDITIELKETLKFEGGWELKGIIGHTEGLVIPVEPDYDLPEHYDVDNNTCEHCNTNRRRNKSFLIQNENDEWMKVGGSCVKKFLGVNPDSYFKLVQAIGEFEVKEPTHDEYGNHIATTYHRRLWNPELVAVDIDKIISITGIQLEIDGGYIKNKWTEITTENSRFTTTVRTNLGESTFDKVKSTYEDMESPLYSEVEYEIDEELVKEVYKYWNSLKPEGTTIEEQKWNHETGEFETVDVTLYSGYEEFLSNIKGYGKKKRIRVMEISKIIPAIQSYFQWRKKQEEPSSEFVGNVGEKMNLELTVTSVSSFESAFGTSNVYKMVDRENNQFIKFGTINKRYLTSGDTVQVGSMLKFKGEIKKHDTFQDKKQTTIGRVSKFV